jgi:hypothetical protein
LIWVKLHPVTPMLIARPFSPGQRLNVYRARGRSCGGPMNSFQWKILNSIGVLGGVGLTGGIP